MFSGLNRSWRNTLGLLQLKFLEPYFLGITIPLTDETDCSYSILPSTSINKEM